MEIQVKTHNITLTDGAREYIDKRVGKLDRINERITDAKLELREEPHHNPTQRFVAQFTIATKHAILRAEERNTDITTAVDLVTDKMARQIRRFHDRRTRRDRRAAIGLGEFAADQMNPDLLLTEPAVDGDEDEELGQIVRTKRFNILPMDTAEAIEQMELLGHTFFVFFNPDTNRMSVLYRRHDGKLGVLEPELA
ncbi:MAG TPA: ribosome-associated translation inhibitor RaiA [Thermomicrobiales bacterium]|nr:ribosome-associated translation inhibitor RaiA [Thermomicrobiales bacterium]HQZ88731.1 ribosome-associated translation inhibitor RaiA [Thermomicrobiales bacterium]HRA32483.1 ribosome-associated translation inhibitor RaiA [Thermomicrobiales bacterium]